MLLLLLVTGLLSVHYLYKVRRESITIFILHMMNRSSKKKMCVPRRSRSGSVAFGLQRLLVIAESLQFPTGALSCQMWVQGGLLGLPTRILCPEPQLHLLGPPQQKHPHGASRTSLPAPLRALPGWPSCFPETFVLWKISAVFQNQTSGEVRGS